MLVTCELHPLASVKVSPYLTYKLYNYPYCLLNQIYNTLILFENLYSCHGEAAANGPPTSGTPPVGSPTSTPADSSNQTPEGAITPSASDPSGIYI